MRMRIYAYKLRMRWTLISEQYCIWCVCVCLGGGVINLQLLLLLAEINANKL